MIRVEMDIDKPTECVKCPFMHDSTFEFCGVTQDDIAWKGIREDCPIQEVAVEPMVEPQESEDWVCKDCWCDDGEVHVECVFCDKIGGEE